MSRELKDAIEEDNKNLSDAAATSVKNLQMIINQKNNAIDRLEHQVKSLKSDVEEAKINSINDIRNINER